MFATSSGFWLLGRMLLNPTGPAAIRRWEKPRLARAPMGNRAEWSNGNLYAQFQRPQTMTVTLRSLLFLSLWAGWLGGLLMGQHPQADPPRRPNIVWIVGENFALDFGCYGMADVHTPQIDGLADRGVRFTNVFSTSPVCAPSRSAFMTGMYATTIDTHNMRSHRNDDYRLPPGVRPITHRLHDVGYRTGNIVRIGDRVVGTGKLDLNFVNEGPLYDTDDWDELTAHQPFFAQINTPEAEYDIYDRRSKEKPRVPWVGEEWHPQVATPHRITPPPYYPDHPLVREEWARYLNSVSGVDVRVGWVLEALERQGLADDTIVMFFADNGRLEARGIHWCFDSGIHVPLIIAWPKNFPTPKPYAAGAVDDRVISLLDVTATTLAMAGVERPLLMQSRVLVGPTADPPRRFAFSARDRIDETVVRQRSVHDGRFHYIRNYTPGAGFLTLNRYKEKCFPVKPLMRRLFAEGRLTGPPAELMRPFPQHMLYDTSIDPHEITNLAESDDPHHQQVLATLQAALDTWIVETGDRGHILEPPEVVAPFLDEMDAWFGTPDWAVLDDESR
ncbi:MAG: sulfatase [Planctomycetota bacterium]|nr:MAG: sulfatase [Planctomycetota bacterium]